MVVCTFLSMNCYDTEYDVLRPRTFPPFWFGGVTPPTNQVRQIPVLQNFCDGSLANMLYWVYDETTATAIIKFQDGCFLLFDKRDQLQFGKWDIHHLEQHQILSLIHI